MFAGNIEALAAPLRGGAAALATLAAIMLACGPTASDDRPDLLLVVLDTVRADAVSALGGRPGITPNLDALAVSGLLYTRAFAAGPWTLPSHASLFTGLRLDQHGVGIRGRVTVPDPVVTLAEFLREAGYETVGLSENPLVSSHFNMTQGFDEFAARSGGAAGEGDLDVVRRLEHWAKTRARERPFLLFVNLFDAHFPYAVRSDNPYLPPGVSAREAAEVKQSAFRICDRLPPRRELEILKGLYLGEVASVDAKLGMILELLRDAGLSERLLVLVTSDHGEHFGERRLMEHQFSVSNRLLNVPLVVHGLPGIEPAVIGTPVSLEDVVPSVLEWTGLPVLPGLSGQLLPTRADDPTAERSLFAGYSDRERADWPEAAGGRALARIPAVMRAGCGPEERAHGEMLALTRYPFKLIWFEHYPSELYDLSWDAGEGSNLASIQGDVAKRLEPELLRFIEENQVLTPVSDQLGELDPEAEALLRKLGYIE